ncbi:MAG TPA: hypothetical protein VK145_03400, partial [Candidatus Nanoarchaeia archaeon]|nr:hypothetical protein [Candidatus Nanoarchaeia archaeon]
GLKARVVGFASSRRDNGATYMVIENDALGGESGSGFVDEHDNLYILSGGIELTTKLSKEKLATDKPLRLVYGPLKIE